MSFTYSHETPVLSPKPTDDIVDIEACTFEHILFYKLFLTSHFFPKIKHRIMGWNGLGWGGVGLVGVDWVRLGWSGFGWGGVGWGYPSLSSDGGRGRCVA